MAQEGDNKPGERPAEPGRDRRRRATQPSLVVVLARHAALGEALCHVLTGAGYRARHVGAQSRAATASGILRASPDIVVVGAEPADDRLDRLSLISDLSASGISVIGLTGHQDDPMRRRLIRRAGAAAVVGATDPLSRFVAVVDAVRDGSAERIAALDPAPAVLSSVEVAQQEHAERLQRLTARERAILEDLRRGRSVGDIARRDVVAEGTVRAQVASILRKLEVSSQLAAVAFVHWAFQPPATEDWPG